MPKRTTPFQAMVRMVREHYVQPHVTITESKFLRDAVTGIEREVDVVIEGELDGEPMVISAEVIEHNRPTTLTWVEQMLRKHRDLPTNRLLLVSKSGFSAKALSLIETEAGRAEALTPEVVEVDGSAVVKRPRHRLEVGTSAVVPSGMCREPLRHVEVRLIWPSSEHAAWPYRLALVDTKPVDPARRKSE